MPASATSSDDPAAPPSPAEPADALAHAALAALLADVGVDAAAPFVALAAEYLAAAGAGEGPVSTRHAPAGLARRFAEPLPRAGRPLADVVARLARDVVGDANRLCHPMYLGHQVSAPLPAAAWADAVVATLNQSVAVAEMSPTGTAVETQVVRWMAELAGFGPRAGGTFTSGGTEATFAALLAARSRAVPDVWANGLGADPPVVVCGAHAHYAVARAAGQMGLGQRNVVTVPSRVGDPPSHAMDPAALARVLGELEASNRRVMAVVATAGSTATGTFDELDAVADRCEARGVWLHVDGAHGASALLSDAHRHRLRGVHRAHSLAWDPHKMMLLPLSAGVVLVREERWLEAAFAQAAPYLFHTPPVDAADAPALAHAEEYDAAPRVWDQGVRSFQCSRRADAIKAWVALQRYGADGIGALYDRLCAMAAALHVRLVAHPAFEALHAPESNILCFRYVGRGRGRLGAEVLDRLNAQLRADYNRSGAGWITSTVLDGRRVLRVTVMNPRTTTAHLDALVAGLAEVGAALEAVPTRH